MGVPAFFRWLSKKYPSIVVHCVEEKAAVIQEMKIPVDATQPNPNDVEFDNLYLDMNGIIHPCCHPEDKPAPKDEDEMMEAIFEYIDRIFNIVRPRRLLYMAIDGVAPRAKMNQQRSRRFRAAKESIEKIEEIKRIREELESRGCELPPMKPASSHFDSNCITPGTEFMARLAMCLQYYIHDRMNSNPAWQGIKVILSDANVPGEGEHKVMDYIRRQRGTSDHDPNTHHCLYGADADLIMLGLATHEPHFTILREEFKPNQPKPCEICGQEGHDMKQCTGAAREKAGEFDEFASSSGFQEKSFIFLRLNILREYLERELRIDGLPFPFDLERAIDDWVFMCFFVGNDFLPHLPSLQIREGAIDRLIRLYKEIVPQTEGYLTHNGKVNLPRVQLILTELGKVEDETFKKRREKELEFRQRDRMKRQRLGGAPAWVPKGQFAPSPIGSTPSPVQNARQEAYHMRQVSSLAANKTAAAELKGWLRGGAGGEGGPGSSSSPLLPNGMPPATVGGEERLSRKRKLEESAEEDEEPPDNVRLWEDGWKERYYLNKFGVPSDDDEFVGKLAEAYTRGLCWVLGYYYQGCPSWKWFYPYHYAPFASDFRNIGQLRNDFDCGTEPFKPLEQLMGVFPAASGKFLPESWRELMRKEDSAIIDFYPTNFKVDLNGKRFAWQGVALLPFVDEERLKEALDQVYHLLTPSEVERNSLGSDHLFVYRHNRLYPFLKTLYESYHDGERNEPVELNPQHTNGVRGTVSVHESMKMILDAGGRVGSPLPQFPDIKQSYAISVNFKDPQYPSGYISEAVLLPGVKMPSKTLRPQGWDNSARGSFRPQIGFATPPPRAQPYHTPQPVQRMIRHSLSEPRSYHYPPPPQHHYSHTYTPPRRPDWNTNTPPPTPPHFQSHYRPPSHFSPHPPQYTPPRMSPHPPQYTPSHMSPPPQPPYTPSGNYYMPPRAPRRSQSDNRSRGYYY